MRALAAVVLLALFLAILWWALADDERGVASVPRPTGAAVAPPEEPEPPALEAPAAPVAEEPAVPVEASEPAPAIAPVRGARNGAVRLDLRVVDARTGEPVPDVAVALATAGEVVHVRTDAAGRVADEARLPHGRVRATVRDAGTAIGSLEKDFPRGDALVWTLAVEIGPTYPVLFDPESALAGATEWNARVIESARPPGVAGELLVHRGELLVAPDGAGLPDRDWSWQESRTGAPRWIRYPSIEYEPDPRRPAVLVVRAGGAEGRAVVERTVGIHAPVVIERVQPVGTVVVLVQDERGAPIDAATVLLVPADVPGETETPVWERARTDANGNVVFAGLAPGPRKLIAFAANHHAHTRHVDVAAGRVQESVRLTRAPLDVGLSLVGPSNGVRGLLGRVILRTALLDALPYARWHVQMDETKVLKGDIALIAWDLPVGRHAVVLSGLDGSPHVRPYALVLDTPHVGHALEPVPPAERLPLRFVVTDARYDAELEESVALLGPEGFVHLRQFGPGWTMRPGLDPPLDAPLLWTVSSEGFAPAYGDESAFHFEDGERVARVALKPGWGAALFLRAGDPSTFTADPGPWTSRFPAGNTKIGMLMLGMLAAPPLPGVEVLADGIAVGRSDAGGAVRLALDRAPQILTLRCEGWRLVAVEREADVRHLVWLAREPH